MSHITLIRHGQANTSARDEVSYDKLSPLGHQQAQWLGAYLRDSAAHHPRVFCGTLTRHVETAHSAGFTDVTQDERLNEIPYFTLSELLRQQRGLEIPDEREGFIRHLPQVFTAWSLDEIDNVPIRFTDYIGGVGDALAEIGVGAGPALVMTSGGLIALVMRGTLGLDMASTARMALAIMNTSMHRIHPIGAVMTPVLFNAIPHLEAPDRHYAQTHL